MGPAQDQTMAQPSAGILRCTMTFQLHLMALLKDGVVLVSHLMASVKGVAALMPVQSTRLPFWRCQAAWFLEHVRVELRAGF